MDYPVVLRRKRIGTIIVNIIMLIVALAAAITDLFTLHRDFGVFFAASALFIATLVFNIIFGTEKTFEIYADKIVTVSKFLPKITVGASELAGVSYASDAKDMLKIAYNTDEFDIEKLSGGSAEFAAMGEGMWTMYISARDVDRPLAEVMTLIESIKTVN